MKKMKCTQVWILTMAFFGLTNILSAQEQEISSNFGIGLQLNQFQNDFGMGLNFTSPYFANKKIAVRLRGNFMYNEHLKNGETVWTPYANASVGVVSTSGMIGNFMRLYGEGGVVGLIPNDAFSSQDAVVGGYGLFGFEFYFSNRNNYFIEIGGIGTGATAENVVNSPIYSNGLLLSVGFRHQIGRAKN